MGRRHASKENEVDRAISKESEVMRVIMCGDRKWSDERKIKRVLQRLYKVQPDTIIVHGACRGADEIVGRLATEMGFPVEAYPANWRRYGRAAGPVRNQQMINESRMKSEQDGSQLSAVFAFHSDLEHSKGTADMVGRAFKHRVPCKVIV